MQSKDTKKKVSSCKKFKQTLTSLDFEATSFSFYLPDGDTQFKTSAGGVAFILLVVVFTTYFLASLINLVSRQDYTVLTFH